MPVPRLPWWLASGLSERRGEPTDIDAALGAQRWSRWMQLPPLRGADDVDAVLVPLGVTSTCLRALLGETPASLARRLQQGPAPKWYLHFQRLWEQGERTQHLPKSASLDVIELVRPLVDGALEELAVRGEALTHEVPESAEAVRGALNATLSEYPLADLAPIMAPTGVLEVHLMKSAGRLLGNTSEERYESFIHLLHDPEVREELLSKYVELARIVTTRLMFWVERRLDFLRAYRDDRAELAHLLGADTVMITDVEFGAGDSHCEGRTVAIVTTDAGRVVYKPRAGDLDAAFASIVDWTNERLPHLPLRALRPVGHGSHTWVEFVDSSITTDDDGADAFSYRLGKFAALLYCLHATDFHFENVAASGSDPVLIDLEALLHKGNTSRDEDILTNVAYDFLADSVRKIGILPDRIFMREGDQSHVVDVSAVGGHGGQEGLVSVPTLVAFGTDEVHIEPQRHIVADQPNAPIAADGSSFNLVERGEPFTEGFRTAYQVIAAEKEIALSVWLPLLASSSVRFIARPTFLYGRLLLKSYHPELLRDRLDRTMFLSKLLHGHPGDPNRTRMMSAEMRDLLQGDIPFFVTQADSGVLRGADGKLIGQGGEAPVEAARQRLTMLNETDLEQQTEVCRYSFIAARVDGENDRWPGWESPLVPGEGYPTDTLTGAACRIGHTLMDKAVRRGADVGWIGLNLVDERWWTLSPATLDLYGGSPGIALALATIGKVSGDEEISTFATGVLDLVARQARQMRKLADEKGVHGGIKGTDCGAFGVIGGPIYALNYAAGLLGRPDWSAAANTLLSPLARLVKEERCSDIVSGAAGALLLAYSSPPSNAAEELAHAAAARLKELALWDHERASWASELAQGEPLVGFSHGTLGIALALAIHARNTGEESWWDLVRGAMSHEAKHFDSQSGDSADLRDLAQDRSGPMRAWCHGAGGGGLGRLLLSNIGAGQLDQERLRTEASLAASALANTGLGGRDVVTGIGNHSICHGDVGNLLVLSRIEGWDVQGDAWRAILASGENGRWLCGVPGGVFTPGLMTGLAGVGWGLAYAAERGALPDVLALEPSFTNGW